MRELRVQISGISTILKLARKKKVQFPSLTHYTLIHDKEKLV